MGQVWRVVGFWCFLRAAGEDCPDGSYRSSPIVFSCGGGFGQGKVLLAAASESAPLPIPLGAEGFRVSASSSAGPLSLRLHDEANNILVASEHHGLVNGSARAGVYKDVGVIFTGSSVSQADNTSLYLLGAATTPMQLSLCNLGNVSASVTLAYTFERVLDCTSPPAGCSTYSAGNAQWQVDVWSHWASAHFENSTEAWGAMAESHAEERGVPWSSWPEVWASFVGNSTVVGEEWQPGFRYLDTSQDGYVSEDEFAAGFALSTKNNQDDTVSKVLSDATGVVRSNLWLDGCLAFAVILLAALCCYCRRSPKTRVARSAQLSRPPQVARAGAAPPPSGAEKAEEKGSGPEAQCLDFPGPGPQGQGQGPGLWLFPNVGQGFGGFRGFAGFGGQESFRYQPVAMEDMNLGVPRAASFESFSGWPAQQTGSFSMHPQTGSFSMQPPQFQPNQFQPHGDMAFSQRTGSPLGSPLGSFGTPAPFQAPQAPEAQEDMWRFTPSFQVQMPRAEATFHAQPAPATAPGPPGQPGPGQPGPGLAPVEPYVPQVRPVMQAELAGPVQIELQDGGFGRDHWAELASILATSPPLSAEIRPARVRD
ncbi:unnamed protein product [Effrenium voratum]|uniref:EF-hand domain-containing protein n=1 Tax=Effrenium voratum TaxID=2562239 RepID=A0AA36HYQ6_9DINO|nr:unnamed protein product [Effrenium voratum]CAJ1417028.1 unnamed protein product [Effrenium voratum]